MKLLSPLPCNPGLHVEVIIALFKLFRITSYTCERVVAVRTSKTIPVMSGPSTSRSGMIVSILKSAPEAIKYYVPHIYIAANCQVMIQLIDVT
jgi:hypothetical protein